jgi:hypothetical protein
MRCISPAHKNRRLLRALANCQKLSDSTRVAGKSEWPAGLSCTDPQRELAAMLELRAVLQALARKLNGDGLAEAKPA